MDSDEHKIRADTIVGVWSYLESINWEEPWLWLLMSGHMICAAVTSAVLIFNTYRLQVGLFVIYLAGAYCSEYINEWAAKNYKKFSTQQYFDSQGMFISLLFSLPLLLNSMVIVVYWMWDVIRVMIGLKKTKVRLQQKSREAAAKKLAESDETTAADKDTKSPKSDEDKKTD